VTVNVSTATVAANRKKNRSLSNGCLSRLELTQLCDEDEDHERNKELASVVQPQPLQ
jgi:hypothetical protein